MPDEIPAPPTSVRRRDSETALESATAYVERSVRTNGLRAVIADGEQHGFEWRALYKWADARSLIFCFPPERLGGREHDVTFDDKTGRWLKFTKPWSAGYALSLVGDRFLMLNATPLQYLRRWRIANRLFGQDTELCGIFAGADGERIIVSQRDAQGRFPSWDEIEESFCGLLGMHRILSKDPLGAYEARAYRLGRFAVFDVRPKNCVLLQQGALVPIDVIPQFLTRTEANSLDRITTSPVQ